MLRVSWRNASNGLGVRALRRYIEALCLLPELIAVAKEAGERHPCRGCDEGLLLKRSLDALKNEVEGLSKAIHALVKDDPFRLSAE